MNPPLAIFYSRSSLTPQELLLGDDFILFHGCALDERGSLAISFGDASPRRVLVQYDIGTMSLSVDGVTISADSSSDLFRGFTEDQSVVLEATTLGFAELFSTIRALIDIGVKRVEVIYVEPLDYTKPKGADQYALSDLIKGYLPIPNSIVDLTSDDLEAGVFFLGFESERLERALEEHQMIATKDIKVVFGIPAFQPGWELNSIVPHLTRLSEQGRIEIAYCAANDPEAAFECLEATRASLGAGKSMFVAPIGTKPCGIASAVFASIYPDQVGLLFDHPKRKANRSEGASLWHRYSIVLGE
ncbi:hypothetical protein [Pseudomonas aeruginosa]|uniref:hypothetical protein n=1 Tax=Pseudomonas aeruginosa TaxID=287 RepID=UPI0023581A44|nr:hypothetical protein [Pseudomonas aeruginosa]MDY1450492.1 hypothetical protein [Pseudomonas aeruginosa]HEJ2935018.1 hypothetical protein [Pseudomonas aeruginosa]